MRFPCSTACRAGARAKRWRCRWNAKIASGVGVAEVVLLIREQGSWAALATGDLSLDAIARAEALLIVPGAAEGFAAGTVVDAYILRE
ncbi:molybdopterin biosynthesis enzyme [Bradyrhizobium elkanii]